MGKLQTARDVIAIIRDLLLIVLFIGGIVVFLGVLALVQQVAPLLGQAAPLLGMASAGDLAGGESGFSPFSIPYSVGGAGDFESPKYKDSEMADLVASTQQSFAQQDYEKVAEYLSQIREECGLRGYSECIETLDELEEAVMDGDFPKAIQFGVKLQAMFSG